MLSRMMELIFVFLFFPVFTGTALTDQGVKEILDDSLKKIAILRTDIEGREYLLREVENNGGR